MLNKTEEVVESHTRPRPRGVEAGGIHGPVYSIFKFKDLRKINIKFKEMVRRWIGRPDIGLLSFTTHHPP